MSARADNPAMPLLATTPTVVLNFGLLFFETVWNLAALTGLFAWFVVAVVLADMAVGWNRRRRGEPEA